MIPPENNLRVPLPLAEMLHAMLGPLGEQLTKEGHAWAPFITRVVDAYKQGRDDFLCGEYGHAILRDVDMCTYGAADALCQWIAEMASEEEDFELWSKEFLDGREASDEALN